MNLIAERREQITVILGQVKKTCLAMLLAAASTRLAVADVYVDAPETPPAEDVIPGINYFLGDQFVADDNIFRLPAGEGFTGLLDSPNFSRSDHINSASAGLTDLWVTSRQSVDVNLSLSNNRYSRNTFLDSNSYEGHVKWNAQASSLLTGTLGVDYTRKLADFEYTRIFAKDLVDAAGYTGNARLQIAPRWALTASINRQDIDHGLTQAASSDFHGTSGSFGGEYNVSETDSVELRYKYSDDRFPNYIPAAGIFRQDFNESTTQLLAHYEPSDRTTLLADAGYLKRHYVFADLPDVSGDVWHFSATWQATEHIQLVGAAGSDLRAYVDLATKYFIAKDESAKLLWTPREKFTLSVVATWEHQNYVAASNAPLATIRRVDDVDDRSFVATYTPRMWLSFNASVTLHHRASNYPVNSFDDRQLSAAFKITL